ncbi:MAG TPA: hypothetical protein VFY83_03870 [Anaerolineales bacterium]|jgi:hypothetical protein|nr:hypothetical protein [Anaerolineales bacterium]
MSHIVVVNIGGTHTRMAFGQLLCKPFEQSLRNLRFHPYCLGDLVITGAAHGVLALARMKIV